MQYIVLRFVSTFTVDADTFSICGVWPSGDAEVRLESIARPCSNHCVHACTGRVQNRDIRALIVLLFGAVVMRHPKP